MHMMITHITAATFVLLPAANWLYCLLFLSWNYRQETYCCRLCDIQLASFLRQHLTFLQSRFWETDTWFLEPFPNLSSECHVVDPLYTTFLFMHTLASCIRDFSQNSNATFWSKLSSYLLLRTERLCKFTCQLTMQRTPQIKNLYKGINTVETSPLWSNHTFIFVYFSALSLTFISFVIYHSTISCDARVWRWLRRNTCTLSWCKSNCGYRKRNHG